MKKVTVKPSLQETQSFDVMYNDIPFFKKVLQNNGEYYAVSEDEDDVDRVINFIQENCKSYNIDFSEIDIEIAHINDDLNLLQPTKESLIQKAENFKAIKIEFVLNPLIKKSIGNYWEVTRFERNMLTISVIEQDAEKAKKRSHIFGQDIEFRYDDYRYGKKMETLETNIGSCGSMNVFDETYGSRTRFYIDLGKILQDTETLEKIKKEIIELRENYDIISKEISNLNQ